MIMNAINSVFIRFYLSLIAATLSFLPRVYAAEGDPRLVHLVTRFYQPSGMKLNLSMARVVLPSKLGLKELINFYRLFQK
jgi:hypothetical protein